MTHNTLSSVFTRNAEQLSGDVIIKYKKSKGAPYSDLTWGELFGRAEAAAMGLIAAGLKPGDRLAILSANRIEWIIADLATLLAGGVDVPIYHTSTAEQCAYVLSDSGSRFVVVEDPGQLAKVIEKRPELKKLERIFIIEGAAPKRTRPSRRFRGSRRPDGRKKRPSPVNSRKGYRRSSPTTRPPLSIPRAPRARPRGASSPTGMLFSSLTPSKTLSISTGGQTFRS